MANKLGLHINTWTGSAVGTVQATAPNCLKVLSTAVDHGVLTHWRAQRPSGNLIYREFINDDRLDNVQQRCDQLLSHVQPIRDLVNFVETPWNEQHQGAADLDRYAEATIRAVEILHADGLNVLVGHFSEENPDLAAWPHFHDAIRASDGLSLHEYSAPRMQDLAGTRCLRYRQVYAQLPQDCRKSLFITECGIDTGVLQAPGPDHGWRSESGVSPVGYAGQMRWYAQAIAQDSYVMGATIFACGAFHDFASFDVAGIHEIESLLREDFPQPNVGGPPVIAIFTFGFKDFHDKDPQRIGEATENAWGSSSGNVHQGTTKGELLWHKAADKIYFADTGGILWEWNGTNAIQVSQ